MADLPRFTGSLRVFAGITGSSDPYVPQRLHQELEWKRQSQTKSSGLTWSEIKTLAGNSKDKKHATKITRELEDVARQFLPEEANEAGTPEAAAFLFETFRDCDKMSSVESTKLRNMFGPYAASLAKKAFDAVLELLQILPADINDQTPDTEKNKSRKYFGHKIKVNVNYEDYDFNTLYNEFDDSHSSNDQGDHFVQSFRNKMFIDKKVAPGMSNGHIKDEAMPSSAQNKISSSWLYNKCSTHSQKEDCSLSTEELTSAIFDVLSSSKSNDQIQNDLFDLLGFEAFDLIQELLSKRQEVVEAACEQADPVLDSDDFQYQHIDPSRKRDKPLPGNQVTIQSEEERKLMRKMQKEERKLLKKNPELYNEIFHQNQEQLEQVQNAPLFQKAHTDASRMYPYVFDSFAAKKNSSAFVGGAKVLLPDGSTKDSCRTYDEITIPASSTTPPEHTNVAIDIKKLDKVGQRAFQGIKRLNRIQSIVFDAAYNTNENLLISAPTGAGKTNIAMLTVLHEIRNHIKNDVIKKDDFKIIYVAPMKALAAEMTAGFGKRLLPLGINVRELTGDMQMTKREISETQMIITTPEKWDVVTRKGVSDVALTQIVKLLIIDEVHLLHDDRGAVLEALVARTLRQVENTQNMIRIVGLSATLPNYLDVARFLNVNPYKGLFYFDGRFRPVPLEQKFIGVRSDGGIMRQLQNMDEVCYEKVLENVQQGHQVMVFVHARNATVKTAMLFREMAQNQGDREAFLADKNAAYAEKEKRVMKSRNKPFREMFPEGFGCHHAGMLRQDRTLVESLFSEGYIKVLVCTATLAWGVNLPAHAVIIKGTEVYDAKKSEFVDIGILDVMQIFGRAGRPQFDKWGSGTIITKHARLSHYLLLLTQQTPIESQFVNKMTDNLNAEVAAGTVTNVDEAVKWLGLTYLYIRMRVNPLAYGVTYKDKEEDPLLEKHRLALITSAAKQLDQAKMIRFVERTKFLYPTNLGRTASNFYIDFATILTFNQHMTPYSAEDEIFRIVSQAHEFEQLKLRDDECTELEHHCFETCHIRPYKGESKKAEEILNEHTKVNILLQAYISKEEIHSFSLISDMAYIAQNAARIIRAMFEIALQSNWPVLAARMLTLSKCVDKRLWEWDHPFRQCEGLRFETLRKLEDKKLTIERIKEMSSGEVGRILNHPAVGSKVVQYAYQFPQVRMACQIQPITRNVLRISLKIVPDFTWNDKMHGQVSEPWWIWVEDPDNNTIYHSEYFMLTRKAVKEKEDQDLVFTIPIFDPLPPQYYVRMVSDRWLHAEAVCAISFKHLILPDHHPPHTELLNLQPLSILCLRDSKLEALYKFTHFNPIQTQLFHSLYYSDTNLLLGAPTGSGKTIAAEIAMFRVFREYPKKKVVYIAPLKALVRERITDWNVRLKEKLGKSVIELTGDVTPDMRAISDADVIVTTPEKWDGVSRSWQTRKYVKDVALLVIDEIHLLGDDRGPVLEVIVSRTNFISNHTTKKVRIIGLSTALANAKDLADWLNIGEEGLFNFRPAVRPVPLQVHIAGYPGKHYCPRMATMNKPCFKGIQTHSPDKPVLIFVSSRRQTRLTALDLVAFLATEPNPKQWLHIGEAEIDNILIGIKDQNLRLTLSFGIGLHHAGLHPNDRKICEELFVNSKIQVLIATSTLAWGVNFPAHLVIVKGTEFYDGKTKRYVDFPITDVLQMMGRAGRPQFDDQGYALILVHDIKKHFYKKFLYDPFPVESNLLSVLSDHLNAEIVGGTINSKQDALDYMTWTYFFRRLLMNPTFYGLQDTDHNSMNAFLSNLVERSVHDLKSSYCVDHLNEDDRVLEPTVYGRIASYYYLSHLTLRMYKSRLHGELTVEELLNVLCDVQEYEELPVRHNEDQMNAELAESVPLEVNKYSYDSPHTKAHLLLQAHFSRTALPIADYVTDTKSVLDQAIRILQSMIDASAEEGWLATVLQIITIVQMIIQGRWYYDSPLLTLPNVTEDILEKFKVPRSGRSVAIETLPELIFQCKRQKDSLRLMLADVLSQRDVDKIGTVLSRLPVINVSMCFTGRWKDQEKVKDDNREIDINDCDRSARKWFPLHADHEYTLKVKVTRRQLSTQSVRAEAYSPFFTKPQPEGWFFVVGNIDTKELVALKRVGFIRATKEISLTFYAPEQPGRKIYTLYLMSDTYQGLDQQYDLYLDVLPALPEDLECDDDYDLAKGKTCPEF